jgi:wyosine [tRNA(Phe)-imidazoG37] synthetase (radical SAM superfamily)
MLTFAEGFQGILATETMLMAGVNDSAGHVRELATFLGRLKPAVAYLAVPTRPPAEPWVRRPDEEVINRAYQIVHEQLPAVELLTGYEGNPFASSGDTEADLLSITAVHPMRKEAVQEVLRRNGDAWFKVDLLVRRGRLVQLQFEGRDYFLRRLS